MYKRGSRRPVDTSYAKDRETLGAPTPHLTLGRRPGVICPPPDVIGPRSGVIWPATWRYRRAIRRYLGRHWGLLDPPPGGEHNVGGPAGRRLEIPRVALIDDHRSHISPVGHVIKSDKLAEFPAGGLLLDTGAPVRPPVAGSRRALPAI